MLNIILNGWRPAITKIAILCGLVGLAAWTLPAIAQAFFLRSNWICDRTETVVEALKGANESVRAVGKMQLSETEGLIMSIWVSKEGSWSVIATSQKSPTISCIVVTGDNFTRYNTTNSAEDSI